MFLTSSLSRQQVGVPYRLLLDGGFGYQEAEQESTASEGETWLLVTALHFLLPLVFLDTPTPSACLDAGRSAPPVTV